MTTFTIKDTAAVEQFLATNAYLSGANQPGQEDAALLTEMETAKFVPSQTETPNFFGWWWTVAPFRPAARALWTQGKAAAKKEQPKKEAAPAKPAKKEEDDEDLDLFGSDDEDDEAELDKLRAAAKKGGKKKPPAKSVVGLEVKGYEVEFDWDALYKKITAELAMEGLTWSTGYQIVDIAFGMKKLVIEMIIVDDLISSDDVTERIEEFDDVQSCDVVSFNKA